MQGTRTAANRAVTLRAEALSDRGADENLVDYRNRVADAASLYQLVTNTTIHASPEAEAEHLLHAHETHFSGPALTAKRKLLMERKRYNLAASIANPEAVAEVLMSEDDAGEALVAYSAFPDRQKPGLKSTPNAKRAYPQPADASGDEIVSKLKTVMAGVKQLNGHLGTRHDDTLSALGKLMRYIISTALRAGQRCTWCAKPFTEHPRASPVPLTASSHRSAARINSRRRMPRHAGEVSASVPEQTCQRR